MPTSSEVLFAVKARLPVGELRYLVPGIPGNHLPGSGVRAAAPGDAELAAVWAAHLRDVLGGREAGTVMQDPPRSPSGRP